MKLRAVVVALALVPGCLQDVLEENPGSGSRAPTDDEAALAARYDIHALVRDDQIEGGADVTVEQVQAFLVRKGSALADYVDADGVAAADAIVTRGRASNIHPIYLLARLQAESSIVSSGSLHNVDRAAGCGCPDGSSCATSTRGFAKQVQCAAEKMREYLDDLDDAGETVALWAVGRTKKTLDPCWPTPTNRATAALYTYTPWVGDYGLQCRKAGVGGSTLVVDILHRYETEMGAAPASTSTFCVGKHGIWCDGDELVSCGTGGGVEVSRAPCDFGCTSMPAGTPDQCADGPADGG
jgi:hypothetical protein